MAFPPKSQREQAMMLVSILALALIGLYWTYVFSPKGAALVEMTARVDTLDSRNNRARAELANGNIEAVKAEAERHARDLDVMRQLVPTGNEVPALLDQVSSAAKAAGLEVTAVKPEPIMIGAEFDTYRYSITVAGPYHSTASFLAAVGSLTRIMAPVNLGIDLQTGNNKAKLNRRGESMLSTTFELQTYVAHSAPKAGGKA